MPLGAGCSTGGGLVWRRTQQQHPRRQSVCGEGVVDQLQGCGSLAPAGGGSGSHPPKPFSVWMEGGAHTTAAGRVRLTPTSEWSGEVVNTVGLAGVVCPWHGRSHCPSALLQLVDLGQPAYVRGGQAGCRTQQAACVGGCGHRGECVGGLEQPECQCEAGWEGPHCTASTPSAALTSFTSYIKMSLTFTPSSQVVTAQLRVRTRGTTTRILLRLSSLHQVAAFTIHVSRIFSMSDRNIH